MSAAALRGWGPILSAEKPCFSFFPGLWAPAVMGLHQSILKLLSISKSGLNF